MTIQPFRTATVGDAVKARDARFIRAQSWRTGHLDDYARIEEQVWDWIERGGPAPWDPRPDSGAQPYPPREPRA